jgi:hypothetical protein
VKGVYSLIHHFLYGAATINFTFSFYAKFFLLQAHIFFWLILNCFIEKNYFNKSSIKSKFETNCGHLIENVHLSFWNNLNKHVRIKSEIKERKIQLYIFSLKFLGSLWIFAYHLFFNLLFLLNNFLNLFEVLMWFSESRNLIKNTFFNLRDLGTNMT